MWKGPALAIAGLALFFFGIPGGFEVVWVWVGAAMFVAGVVMMVRVGRHKTVHKL